MLFLLASLGSLWPALKQQLNPVCSFFNTRSFIIYHPPSTLPQRPQL